MAAPAHPDHADGPVLAAVLARAGSKGVPGKNTAPVAGRPCVAWTIAHALQSAADAVVVSSDSDEVLAIARDMGAHALRRTDDLATDTARVDDALREAAAWFEREHRRIAAAALLYGNVPVRPPDLTDRAITLWRQSGCDSVQSYAPVGKHHPWWQARITSNGAVAPWQGERLFNGIYRRQELPPAHIPDGGVIVVSRPALFHELKGLDPAHPHSFLGRDHRGVINPEGAVIDIDTPTDLLVADTMLRSRVTAETTEHTETTHTARDELVDQELTDRVINAAIEVHRALGPGMLESAYEQRLAAELASRGLHVERQVEMPLEHKGQAPACGYRADLIVEGRVIIELKAVDRLLAVHEAQLLADLRMSGLRIGLLFNFNAKLLKDGMIRRIL